MQIRTQKIIKNCLNYTKISLSPSRILESETTSSFTIINKLQLSLLKKI